MQSMLAEKRDDVDRHGKLAPASESDEEHDAASTTKPNPEIQQRGWGKTTMKGKVNEVQKILHGCPTKTLFAALATVWKRECPDEPSLPLMREMASAGKASMLRVARPGPHQEHPQHRLISNVTTMATAPREDSGELLKVYTTPPIVRLT